MNGDLLTLDSDTQLPPKSRIGSAENCAGFVFRLSDNDQLRAQIRTKIKGNINGNAPFPKREMEAKNMGGNTNLNFRQGKATIDQFSAPYYDLAVEVPMLCNIQTAFGTSTERGEWSQIISEEYDRMVNGWPDWDFVLQFSQVQMLIYGIGCVFFPDNIDWRPDCAKAGDVLVRDRARSRVSELDALVILKGYNPPDLYKYIRNPAVAKELGWEPESVRRAIIDAKFGGTEPTLTASQLEWYEEQFKNADLCSTDDSANEVRTGNVLSKEFPTGDETEGRVTHSIVRTDRVTNQYLYQKIGRFDSMDSVIIPFFYDIGDGTWHSINGVGKDIYAYCRVFDMLRCREVDGAMIASSLLLQPKSANSVTKSQLMQITNLNIVPPDLNVVPLQMGQGIEATTGVRRDMEATLATNIGNVTRAPNQPNPRKGQKLGIMEMQQAAQLGKGKINRWYTQYDRIHWQMYHRAVSSKLTKGMQGGASALEFQRRCVMRGVPIEALQQIDSIRAYRSVGAGSAANRVMVTEAIMEHAGSYSEEGKQEALRIYLSTMAGNQIMHSIMGDKNPSDSNDDAWEATMENNALRTGGEVLITKSQSNVLHLTIHFKDADDHVQQVQEQAAQDGMQMNALQSLFVHLDATGKHGKNHLDAIANDPIREGDYKELQKHWQQLARIQDQVKQQLEEMMQSQQAQQPQGSGGDPMDIFSKLDYGKAPESVKDKMEKMAGVPREEGDLSVPAKTEQLKQETLALKKVKEGQNMVINDVNTSLNVKKTNKELAMTP